MNYLWIGKLSFDSLPYVRAVEDPSISSAIAAFARALVITGRSWSRH